MHKVLKECQLNDEIEQVGRLHNQMHHQIDQMDDRVAALEGMMRNQMDQVDN